MTIEHGVQPTGSQLGVVFCPLGVEFHDLRGPNASGRITTLSLKHGRLSITGIDEPAASLDFLINRHIREIRVVSNPDRLRLGLSDVCIDLFDGVTLAELEWVETVIETELQHHFLRKEAALNREPLPDQWKFTGPKYPSWQESKGLLLMAGLFLSLAACLLCVRDISQTLATASDSVLDPDVLWRTSLVGTALCLTLALGFRMICGLFQWHNEAAEACC